jgi:hypothetical protein
MARRISLIGVAGIAALALTASALAQSKPQPERYGLGDFPISHAKQAQMMREDGFDRAVAAKLALRSNPKNMFRRVFDPDLFRVDAVSAAAPVSAPDSSPGIEWLQLGIGVGIGILFGLGLWLAVRLTRTRSPAHG